MQIILNQTHHTIADFETIFSELKRSIEGENTVEYPQMHLYPELYLTGYPLQDICLQREFIFAYNKHLDELNKFVQSLPKKENLLFLVSGLKYDLDPNGLPRDIRNVIYKITPGEEIEDIYTKILLPNYDIFDEEKYFTPGNSPTIINFNGRNFGLLICEDMWFSTFHDLDPIKLLEDTVQDNAVSLDGIINLSGSPYHLGKEEKRIKRAIEISNMFKCPFIYVNRVGGEDEILFDGASFVVSSSKVVAKGHLFKKDTIEFKLEKLKKDDFEDIDQSKHPENTWESLFAPHLDLNSSPAKIFDLSDDDCGQVLNALKFGIQEYARKSGFSKFLVALSGGIDSALVLTIARFALKEGQELEAVYMPSMYSSSLSYDLSLKLCQNLGIKMTTLSIKFLHSTMRNAYLSNFNTPMEGLTDENIQSRLRGSLIYARSNEKNSMVLNTSNKSEIAVGYSTLYGDSVGAISVLGDLYKTEVFSLANYINTNYQAEFSDGLIPNGIIQRPPTAELRENQEDSQSLPPYDELDAILEGILSQRFTKDELEKMGHNRKNIDIVYGHYVKSEYKRRQMGPIIKIKQKSFGFGYRVPISKNLYWS